MPDAGASESHTVRPTWAPSSQRDSVSIHDVRRPEADTIGLKSPNSTANRFQSVTNGSGVLRRVSCQTLSQWKLQGPHDFRLSPEEKLSP